VPARRRARPIRESSAVTQGAVATTPNSTTASSYASTNDTPPTPGFHGFMAPPPVRARPLRGADGLERSDRRAGGDGVGGQRRAAGVGSTGAAHDQPGTQARTPRHCIGVLGIAGPPALGNAACRLLCWSTGAESHGIMTAFQANSAIHVGAHSGRLPGLRSIVRFRNCSRGEVAGHRRAGRPVGDNGAGLAGKNKKMVKTASMHERKPR